MESSSSGMATENAKCPPKAPEMQAIQIHPLKSINIIITKRLKALETANSTERTKFCLKVILPLIR